MPGTSFCPDLSGGHGARSPLEEYEEVQVLGRGSFAVVKKMRHVRTHGYFAMKVMPKKRLQGTLRPKSEVQSKLLSEARILRGLDHPNVVKYHDMFEWGDDLFLVMELVEGEHTRPPRPRRR